VSAVAVVSAGTAVVSAAGATVAVVSVVASVVSPELHAAKKPATAKIANTFFIVLVFLSFFVWAQR
jgi:hypothetical protein